MVREEERFCRVVWENGWGDVRDGRESKRSSRDDGDRGV